MLFHVHRLFPVILLFAFAGTARGADSELVSRIKQLGTAVDNMTAHISTAESDADAELLAGVTRQAFAQGLKDFKPDIVIEASQGYCRATISTPEWRLWSEARGGKVVDHGAKIH